VLYGAGSVRSLVRASRSLGSGCGTLNSRLGPKWPRVAPSGPEWRRSHGKTGAKAGLRQSRRHGTGSDSRGRTKAEAAMVEAAAFESETQRSWSSNQMRFQNGRQTNGHFLFPPRDQWALKRALLQRLAGGDGPHPRPLSARGEGRRRVRREAGCSHAFRYQVQASRIPQSRLSGGPKRVIPYFSKMGARTLGSGGPLRARGPNSS